MVVLKQERNGKENNQTKPQKKVKRKGKKEAVIVQAFQNLSSLK